MGRFRYLFPLLFLIVLIWIGVSPVQAHAVLIRSIPAENAALARSPSEVDLYFDEAVEPKLSKLNVLDTDGNVVDLRDGRVDPTDGSHMSATLQPLSDGVYTVVWNVISADDGHQSSGSYPSSVGNVSNIANSSPENGGNISSFPFLDGIVKGFLYIPSAILMGSFLFVILVWNPSKRRVRVPAHYQIAYDKYLYKLTLAALILFGVANLVSLSLEAGHASETIIGIPWQPDYITVLLDTRFGVLSIARFSLAILLAGLLLPPMNKWNRWIGLAGSLLLLLTFSLESHAAAEARPTLPVLADWIHIVAVSVWIGGLFSFLGSILVLRGLNSEYRSRFISIVIPNFTKLALTSVAVLVVTGLYSAELRLGTFNALLDTPYGQALILKLVIASIMIFIGAVNILYTTPAMRLAASTPGGSPMVASRFHKILTVEVVLGIVILIWVGIFTNLPPSKVSSTPFGFYQTTKVDDLAIALNVDPNQTGMNTFNVFVSSHGLPISDAQNVVLEFTPHSGMMPASKADLKNQGHGTYNLQGGYFGMPDTWDVKVVVTLTGKSDVAADFNVDNSAPKPQPVPWRGVALSMLIAMGLGYAFAFRVLDHNTPRWVGLGVLPAAAFIVVNIILLVQFSLPLT